MMVIQIEEMPAAARAEFQRISPDVEAEANDPDFISDDEDGEDGQDERRSEETER